MWYYVFIHQSIVMASFFYAIFFIYVGNLDTSTWVDAFHILVPFDTRSISGWFVKWLIQLIMSITYVTTVISVTSYFICCYFYIDAMCNNFKYLINLSRENVKGIREENFKRAVDIHVDAYEYVALKFQIKINII